jgi:hypothetical protein
MDAFLLLLPVVKPKEIFQDSLMPILRYPRVDLKVISNILLLEKSDNRIDLNVFLLVLTSPLACCQKL